MIFLNDETTCIADVLKCIQELKESVKHIFTIGIPVCRSLAETRLPGKINDDVSLLRVEQTQSHSVPWLIPCQICQSNRSTFLCVKSQYSLRS